MFFSDGESTTVMLTLSMAIGKRTADIDLVLCVNIIQKLLNTELKPQGAPNMTHLRATQKR